MQDVDAWKEKQMLGAALGEGVDAFKPVEPQSLHYPRAFNVSAGSARASAINVWNPW
jgi:hypothetical protein